MLDTDLSVRLLRKLYTQSLHIDAFINGDGYTQFSTSELSMLQERLWSCPTRRGRQ